MENKLSRQVVEWIETTISMGLGRLSSTGALVVNTGQRTGRSTEERFVVQNENNKNLVDWGTVNKPIDPAFADQFFNGLTQRLNGLKQKFVSEGFVGGFNVKTTSASPWHAIFASNMFRDTPVKSLLNQKQIEIFHLPFDRVSDLGLKFNSETLLVLDPERFRIGIIGTAYAGEIKKSAFTLCNYHLPSLGVLPMHASANCLEDGTNSSVLFGLSGTGKTTLSASPDRFLIGDDEIVWGPGGLSNLEGGCYAKLIDLKREKEPEIYRAVNQFGSIMENVVMDSNREVDFCSNQITENTRGSYNLHALPKVFDVSREAQAPKTVVFLTADAFGALPSVARLSPEQAQYHFISGYTAKVAGTEIGVKEPKAAFSTCFGAPFMPRPSSVYAKLLAEYASKYKASIWLLNTGWANGGYGKGERFPISVSRRILAAIQDGRLEKEKSNRHPVFGFEVPKNCPGLESNWLNVPEGGSVRDLAQKFVKNFEKYSGHTEKSIAELGGPTL
jgi:phosphoenolpyruvate carboxykinase (ATP)